MYKMSLEKKLNYTVVLNINSNQVDVKKSAIVSKDVGPKGILELTKQNEAILIKSEASHGVLGECLK